LHDLAELDLTDWSGWSYSLTAAMVTCSLCQSFAEALDSFQAFLEIVHAGGIAQAYVIVRTEGDPRDSSHFFGLEQLGAKFAGLEAGSGNVREQIKCSFDIHARNTRNRV